MNIRYCKFVADLSKFCETKCRGIRVMFMARFDLFRVQVYFLRCAC
jgi:hypothetical protein